MQRALSVRESPDAIGSAPRAHYSSEDLAEVVVFESVPLESDDDVEDLEDVEVELVALVAPDFPRWSVL